MSRKAAKPIKQVDFCHFVRVNNELLNTLRNDKHDFHTDTQFLHVTHKETDTHYQIPLSNVSTITLE